MNRSCTLIVSSLIAVAAQPLEAQWTRYVDMRPVVEEPGLDLSIGGPPGQVGPLAADQTKYFVILAAQAGVPGHAFVIWGRESMGEQMTSIEAFGFYPTVQGAAVAPSAVGPVPGALLDEILKNQTTGCCAYSAPSVLASFRVDYDTFKRTQDLRRRWQEQASQYQLLVQDCVTFVKEMGEEMGFPMPARGPLTASPVSYLRNFLGQFASPGVNGVKIGNRYYNVTVFPGDGNFDPQYSVRSVDGDPRTGRVYARSGLFITPRAGEDGVRARHSIVETYDSRRVRTIDMFVEGDQYQTVFFRGTKYSEMRLRDGRTERNVFYPDSPDAVERSWMGGSYKGGWRDNVPHGHGTWADVNGASYTGRWDQGRPHGEGKAKAPNGDTYEGQWSAGVPHGRGTFTWKAGGQFEGTFSYGLPSDGVTVDKNGTRHSAQGERSGRDGGAYGEHLGGGTRGKDDGMTGSVKEYSSSGEMVSERPIRGMEFP